MSFTLLGSHFSVRVQVRRAIPPPAPEPEQRTLNAESNVNTN